MTFTLLAMYHHPEDPAAFDQHYEQTHTPLGLALPGLVSFTSTKVAPQPDGSPGPYYRVTTLAFESAAALGASLSSAEGQAVVADLGNFAGAGVTMLQGDTVVSR